MHIFSALKRGKIRTTSLFETNYSQSNGTKINKKNPSKPNETNPKLHIYIYLYGEVCNLIYKDYVFAYNLSA